ncbi:MAG TPA: DEAD/DEAH box helicase, partial [Pirellulaceae bacterium]
MESPGKAPDQLSVVDVLGPRGLVARQLARFESRPEQLRMAEATAGALHDQKHLLVEAGTGVGKSFAYLVPAILAATEPASKERHGRVIISTHTISLQEQLLHKDIPFLSGVIPREFSTCLVKGRRNYLSRRRMELARTRMATLFGGFEEVNELKRIVTWAHGSGDGSLSDLTWKPQSAVWDEVASDHGNCLGKHCPTYSTCFYYRARRRMQHAQILLVNHALFFSDLALRAQGASLLPEFDAVIFDEAHTIPAVASEHLGLKVSSRQIEYALLRLYNDRTQKGLLVTR